jgi:catechol-2,3-dioxygenase
MTQTEFPPIGHVVLTVRDLSASVPWYEALLQAPTYGSGLSFRDPDGIALEFFAPPS